MEKLKICHVSLAVYPNRRDGAAKYQKGIFDELRRRGHKITLLTAQWPEGPKFDDPDIVTVDVPNSRFTWLPKFTLTFRKYLKTHDFDIIQGNASRGSLPAMFSGKPYLSHIHDIGAFQTTFTKIPGLKMMERRNAQKAQRIMCCAESAGVEISQVMGVPLSKITNVSSAVDPIYKPMPKEAAELKESMKLNGPVMFYVGRIAFYKGIDDIIAAYRMVKKQIPDLTFILGGKPTVNMEQEVEKWKRENPDIIFPGLIPDEQMPIYYSMSNVFVTYSFASEGFGLTPVESLTCGTPVICSSLPAYKEVLQEHGTFVEPKQPQLLAKEILHHLKNPEFGKQKVKSAAPFIKRYTWEEVGNLVEKVYQEYMQEKAKN